MIRQVKRYKKRHEHYPEAVLVAPIYGTQVNRKYLKEKQQRKEDYQQRIPIEDKFAQGKMAMN